MLKKIFKWIAIVIVLLAMAGGLYYRFYIYRPPLISAEDRKALNILPLPAKLKIKGNPIPFESVEIENETNLPEIVIQGLARLQDRINQRRKPDLSNENVIALSIQINSTANGDYLPSPDMDESYSLSVSKDRIEVVADEVTGALRAMETLYQLIETSKEGMTIHQIKIEDEPLHPWRGLMVDVSRHFIPKDVIIRLIDGMAMAKMNVFHWHLSDDQGFRVESKRFPLLHEVGGRGNYYTQGDIKEVVDFATERGIRVIPEFDVPGHTKSWQIAYPFLSSVYDPGDFPFPSGELFAPPLDPTNDSVFWFIDALVEEMVSLFPDPYFHIGGDEVNPKYWLENATIKAFMDKEGFESAPKLQAFFNGNMLEILKKHNKKMIGWNEIYQKDLATEVTIQAWTGQKVLFDAVSNEGTGILSAGYYLDHIQPASYHYAISPRVMPGAVTFEPDTTFYNVFDMCLTFGETQMENELILFDKDRESFFGLLVMNNDMTTFTDGVWQGNTLTFSFDGPAGKMKFSGELEQGHLNGDLSMGPLNIPYEGNRTGGHDIEGSALPKLEVIPELSPSQKENILGGEACQWAEFVNAKNIESRIWPRTAAIAEKLWSPTELTQDAEDMYRRTDHFSGLLTLHGSRHFLNYTSQLEQWAGSKHLANLRNLTDYLEEIHFHGRMPDVLSKGNLDYPALPLDRLVDAVLPESLPARDFRNLVTEFIEYQDDKTLSEIKHQLVLWVQNHTALSPVFGNNTPLDDMAGISELTADVSNELLLKLDNKDYNQQKLKQKIDELILGKNNLVMAAAHALQQLSVIEMKQPKQQ